MMICARPVSRLRLGVRELGLHANGRTRALVTGGKDLEQRRAMAIEQLDKGRNGMFWSISYLILSKKKGEEREVANRLILW